MRHTRLLWIFLGLVALVLVPFFIWGEALTALFAQGGAVAWLRDYGAWAWGAGILLLMADLALPIPGTVVMAALGYLYGPVVGGLVAGAGSFAAGTAGYTLCRLFGRRAAARIAGADDLAKGEQIFENAGGWLVALSRWLPVFPEVVACMAGLMRMPSLRFHLALACGSFPLGFVFAAIGHAGVERPTLALALSAAIPPVLWLAVRPFFKAKARSE